MQLNSDQKTDFNQRRKMAVEEVRESAERLKAEFLDQMNVKLSAVLNDVVHTIQTADIVDRYNGLLSPSASLPTKSLTTSNHHNHTPTSNLVSSSSSPPKSSSSSSKKRLPAKLPEKVFISRPSPLTELLQITHFKTIHHIFIATLILIMLHNIILDLLERNTVDLGLMRLAWAFGQPQLTLGILLTLEFCGLVVVYPAFHFWSRIRLRLKPGMIKLVDLIAALAFFLFISGMMWFPAQIMWNNPLPPASGATVTMEQCRLLMKIYAFVRSNVPRVLKQTGGKKTTAVAVDEDDGKGNKKRKQVSLKELAPTLEETSEEVVVGNNGENQGTWTEAQTTDFSTELKRRKNLGGGNSPASGAGGGDAEKETQNYSISQAGSWGDNEEDNGKLIKNKYLWEEAQEGGPSYSKYLYFYVAPTLIYKDNYPRTSFVRWDYVCWNFAQVLGCIVYANFILSRYSTFYFAQFGHPQHPMTVLQFCNAVFSMMLPGILGLVLGFYLLLHSWHNAFAEMLCFGDRLFYKDWWNCSSFHSYYKTWNILVHDWLYTYIFKDAWEAGLAKYHKALPTVLVFLISSLFHEYVLSFAFNFFFPVLLTLFGGFGLALTFLRTSDSAVGNIFIWFGLISGSGILVSTYTMEFYARLNCPAGLDSATEDFFTPRFWTCNAIVWE